MPSLLSRYLSALRVPHTASYVDSQFASMPFRSLFGLSRALEGFGVQSRGLRFADKKDALLLPTPFLAQIHGDVVIVKGSPAPGNDKVDIVTMHGASSLPTAEFLQQFSGVVLQSRPQDGAHEPDLPLHRFQSLAMAVKMPLLIVLLLSLTAWGSIQAGIWASVWKAAVMLLDVAGIAVCYLLWLKTNGIKSRVADSMCGLTTEHGCDKVLDTRASSFLGIFKWSEVGMGYFCVSVLALLLVPDTWPLLALLAACCLPYTIWSVLTQKFVIKAWCTLCLTVQGLLWLLSLAYLLGGAWKGLPAMFTYWHTTLQLPALLAAYICGVLLMNLVNAFIAKAKNS